MAPNILLKAERERHGWSQAEVATQINAGETSYFRWETLGVLPTPYYRRELSALFGKTIEELGLLPGQASRSSGILLPEDVDLDGEQIRRAVNANLFLQLCSIMEEPVHECRCEQYAVIIEEFELMNMQNEFAAAMTRRQAVTSLALLPFSPPLCLGSESLYASCIKTRPLFTGSWGQSCRM